MELMEATYGFFKRQQAQQGVTGHSPFAHLNIPNRNHFHGGGDLHSLCSTCSNYFPAEATPTPTPRVYEEKQISSGGKQSMAARERRRKITAKTQELGKLIPGTHKMNTAQMLQAASKYVKFLQAQLALLQRIETVSFNDEGRELPVLIASSAIQERLYLEDKCLAPKQFLQLL